jgi:mRNA-degrading endonuclease toxin of MazEF toxin-antitoxin module
MWSNRPGLIVSNDVDNARAGFVKVVYLTTQTKKNKRLPCHIKVWSGDREAIALCEQIHTIDKSRIEFYVGAITEEESKEIDKALMFSLGISNTVKPSTLFKKWANAVDRYGIDLAEDPNENIENIEIPVGPVIIDTEHMDEMTAMYRILYEHERDVRKTAESMYKTAESTVQKLKDLCTESAVDVGCKQNNQDMKKEAV